MTTYPDVVVGGGLGGLSAALWLARAGRAVTLVDKSNQIGGRAQTQAEGDFRLNLGPHAIYPGAEQLMRELGIQWTQGKPAAGGFALDHGTLHTLPAGFVSLLTTGLFGLGEKVEVARWLGGLSKIDVATLHHVSIREWTEATLVNPRARKFAEALFRLTTYANAPTRQSVGCAIDLVRTVVRKNVGYVDGGWQVFVDALTAAAESAGVRIVTNARVIGLDRGGASIRGVRLDDGAALAASNVILAVSPRAAARLVSNDAALGAWAARAIPARAASLDVALEALPRRRASFVLGVDQPLYFSVHSQIARVAPEGSALLHAAKYLDPDAPPDPERDRAELEALIDMAQPGWREHLVHARFLPSLTVAHAIPMATEGGTAGRPTHVLASLPGVYLVGDWVGDGHLVEASLASAKRVAETIALGPAAAAAA